LPQQSPFPNFPLASFSTTKIRLINEVWIPASWRDLKAEEQTEEICWLEDERNIKDAILGPMLRNADPGNMVYHVSWDTIPGISVKS
jgi:hypothetical protein